MSNIIYKKRSQRTRKKLKRVNTDRFRLTVFRSSRNNLKNHLTNHLYKSSNKYINI